MSGTDVVTYSREIQSMSAFVLEDSVVCPRTFRSLWQSIDSRFQVLPPPGLLVGTAGVGARLRC
jgi:hypothetical protein